MIHTYYSVYSYVYLGNIKFVDESYIWKYNVCNELILY